MRKTTKPPHDVIATSFERAAEARLDQMDFDGAAKEYANAVPHWHKAKSKAEAQGAWSFATECRKRAEKAQKTATLLNPTIGATQ